ncbi:hypothetical protein M0R45_026054 [Rubus argutus]|uniref:Uncharacterized protein n=1 Tax=Rubus argutus TaxID=59490 RepID=A0AAW1WXU2_RUBAR
MVIQAAIEEDAAPVDWGRRRQRRRHEIWAEERGMALGAATAREARPGRRRCSLDAATARRQEYGVGAAAVFTSTGSCLGRREWRGLGMFGAAAEREGDGDVVDWSWAGSTGDGAELGVGRRWLFDGLS